MPAGSVMFHPALFIDYDGNQDNGETIVQIMGYGPVRRCRSKKMKRATP